MEEYGNIFENQQQLGKGTTMAKTREEKPPTRLQKHAPACLKLDQMKVASAASGAGVFGPPSGTTPAAIPLLSPLVLSPHAFPDSHEEFRFPTWSNNNNNNIPSPTPTATAFGWKHPAVSGYMEPSTLFALFQSKCLLVNDA